MAVACQKKDFELEGRTEIGLSTQSAAYKWYALRVRSRHEHVVAMHLNSRGYESFLPTYKNRRRWSDRFKEIELPLFAGYVFCQFDTLNRLPVLTIPGVVQVVGVGKNPAPIDESEIAAIQASIKCGLPRQPWPFLRVGDRVRIEHGPLDGVEGILLRFGGHQRLVLSITLLQRSVAVQINEEWIRPLPMKHGSSSRTAASERLLRQPVA